jgi:primosomal protein N' (replication factor Y)
VQTIAPESRPIAFAAQHDSAGFLTGELERRLALGYPPFSHLIRIVCSAELPGPARAAAGAVREELLRGPDGALAPSDLTVLGPASLFRLRGREREAIVIKAGSRLPAVRAIGAAVARVSHGREHQGVHFSVDVDPQ